MALSLSFQASATSGAVTITVPASAAAGDLAVLYQYSISSTSLAPSAVTPSGWTALTDTSTISVGTSARGMLLYKVLVGGDPGSTVTGMSGSSSDDKVIAVFRPSTAIALVSPSTFNAQMTNGTPTTQTTTATGLTYAIVMLGVGASTGSPVSFSAATPAWGATIATASTREIAAYTIYNSSPSNQSVSMSDFGSLNWLASGYLLVRDVVDNAQAVAVSSGTSVQVIKATAISSLAALSSSSVKTVRGVGKLVGISSPTAVLINRGFYIVVSITEAIAVTITERFTTAINAFRSAIVPFVSRVLGLKSGSRTADVPSVDRTTVVPSAKVGAANRTITLNGWQGSE